jgi:hypothetical protein
MPTPTYTPLANVTLGSSATTVTFSNIPATYRDLILVAEGTSASSNLHLRFNSDSASNYSYVFMFGNGSSTSSGSGTDTGLLGGSFTTTRSTTIYQVIDYSATDKHKTVLNRGGASNDAVFAWAGRWANTVAINNVLVRLSSGGNFNVGTSFSLYGVIA